MAKQNFRRERAWINKKLSSGVSSNELLHSVGAFSNKKKEKVIAQKGISSLEYEKRYKFLGNVYYLLSNEDF